MTRTVFARSLILVGSTLSAQIAFISTYAGHDGGAFPGNGGPATSAIITNPAGLAVDGVGNLYIAASGNSLIRLVNANTGIITTVAGGGTGGDGGLATAALLTNPCDMKLDPWGNLYISETCVAASGGGGGGGGNAGIARIRRVDATTGIITTVAGGSSSGFAGDGGPAVSALLNTPTGLAIDTAGNIFIADAGNNRIRRIDAGTGFISTVAGNGFALFVGDGGPATSASLNSPAGLTVDASGNLYIADTLNNAIRRVDAVTGLISTVAGTGAAGFNGDGIAATTATLNEPSSVILNSGNLVFAELGSNRVRTIDNSGFIWTIAGNGNSSGTQIGDNGPASLAVLSHPFGLAGRPSEPLFISELTGDRVRVDGLPGSLAATAATLTSSAVTSPSGAPVTLTVTLTASNGAATSAGGGVYFIDGTSTLIGSAAIVNGSASITISSLALGVHNISAQYTGSGGFGGSFSPSLALTISAPVTTVSLNVSPNPPAVNQPFSLTAFLTPSSATGTVNFYNGAALLGSAGVSGGTATLSLGGFAAGSYSLTAQYPGDASHAAATSPAVILTVKTTASIVVTSNLNPSPAGQAVAFTAAMTPAAATGTVQFFDGATQIGASAIVAGVAAFSTSSLTSGQHSITASYGGDANDTSAASAAFAQTVNPLITTTTTLQSSQNPLLAGGSVTFTASVSPSTATGTVQFLDGGAVIGAGILSGGATSFSTSALAAGTHSMTAAYGGDTANAASTSAVLSQAVRISAGLVLTITPGTVVAGQTVTLTATLNAAATGTVKFSDGSTVLATIPVAAGAASYSGSFTQGSHSITAAYSGDGTYMPSSSVVNETVLAASAVVLGTSLNPSTQGQNVTFTASVTPSTATGAVQFLDGGAVIGTASLTSGGASFSTAALSAGPHSITAAYGGDTSDSSASSASLNQIVKTVAVVSAASSPNPSISGQTVSITATVTPSTATGTVQFLDGSSVLGTAPVNSGTALLSTSALTQGAHVLTANYSGDANNAAASSSAITQTVNAKTATTTIVTSSVNPAAVGNPVEFAATVSAGTGSVQFFDGATSLGTASLVGTTAELVTSALAQGSHSITAVYGGDAANASSTSAVFTQTVKLNAGLNLLTSLDPSVVGQTVTFTATMNAAATGTVQFLDGSAVLATAAVSGGAAVFSTAGLTQGSHIMSANYSGDSNYLTQVSVGITQTVNAKANTTTTVASSQNPGLAGVAVTFMATVSPATATGTVQFLDAGTVLGAAALASGSASFTTTLGAGVHSISAVYNGDTVDAGSTSAALNQTINLKTTTTTLSSTLNPGLVGVAVTFMATVNPSTATGTVQFLDAGTVLGAAALASGSASFTTTLGAGVHSISAVYNGDTVDAGSTSAALNQTINLKTTTTTLSSTLNPGLVGVAVTFMATVNPSTATGTVQFLDAGTVLAAAALASGSASFTATLGAGVHSISAVYNGDTVDAGSTSAALNQTINLKTTATTVSSTPNPALAGTAVTFSATVNPSTATGSVKFLDGGNVLGLSTLAAGSASFTTSALSQGTHSITAVYSGDPANAGSSSAVLSQVIKLAAGLTMGVSPSPAVAGQTVTIKANVSSAATGTVQFTDGGAVLATAPVSAGVASITTSTLAKGSHTLGVTYSGDGTYMGAVATASEVVLAASTVVVGSNANPAVVGQSVVFTAAVTPSTATGAVQFYDGGTLLGTASLSSGSALFSTAALAKGAHSITATYGGDGLDAPAGSIALSQIVKTAATVSLTSNLNPSTFGQSISFSASVTPSTATGTIQFLDGATVLGTVNVSSGKGVFSTSSLAAGAHSMTASYSGDTYDTAASSTVLTETVNVAAPAAPSNLTGTAAGSSQINLAWTASGTSGVTYNVYGSTSSGFTPSASNRLATGVASTGLSATGLLASTTYYFRVTAVNGGGESTATNQAGATTAGVFACHVSYSVTTQWNVGFTGALAIQNTGSAAINSWTLTWTWPGNQAVTQSWNANYHQSGSSVTLTNETYNNQIAAGATLTGVGFNGSYSGTNPAPTSFYVNGTLCH